MARRKIEVQVVGDARQLERTFKHVGKQAHGLNRDIGRAFSGLAKGTAFAGVAAAVGGLAVVLHEGTKEYKEMQAAAAQSAAVIKSTGGAANVSTKHLTAMATALQNLSGVEDEVVQSGANVLLSFTKIQNKAGKGNKIFDRATKAALDYSVRTGKSIPAAALILGKALEDPAKKISGLARAGIIFSEKQKKVIARLAETGHMLEAQKVILTEWTKRFGGAAAAAGKTFAGSLAILRANFRDLSAQVVGSFMPAMTRGIQGLTEFVKKLQAARGVKAKLSIVWEGLTGLAGSIAAKIGDALSAINWKAAPYKIRAWLSVAWGGIKDTTKRAESALKAAVGAVDWNSVWANAVGIADGIQSALEKTNWSKVGKTIGNGVAKAVQQGLSKADVLGAKLFAIFVAVDWEKLGVAMGPGLAAAVASAFTTLTDPGFWMRHWELSLSIALVVFGGVITKVAAKIGLVLGKALAAPIGRIAAPLTRVFSRLAARSVEAVAAGFERLGFTIQFALLRGLEWVGKTARRWVGIFEAWLSDRWQKLSRPLRWAVRIVGLNIAIRKISEWMSAVKGVLSDLADWVEKKFWQLALKIAEPFSHIPGRVGAPFRDLKVRARKELDGIGQKAAEEAARVRASFQLPIPVSFTFSTRAAPTRPDDRPGPRGPGVGAQADADRALEGRNETSRRQVAAMRAAERRETERRDDATAAKEREAETTKREKAAAKRAATAAEKAKKKEQAAWEKALGGLNVALSRAQLTPQMADDLAALKAIQTATEKRLKLHKNDLALQQQLIDTQSQINALQQQAVDAAKGTFGGLGQGTYLQSDWMSQAQEFGYKPTTADYGKDLAGQTKAFLSLNKDISKVAERGGPASLLTELKSMGAAAAPIAKALASGSAAAFQSFVKQWKTSQSAIQRVAKVEMTAQSVVIKSGDVKHDAGSRKFFGQGGLVPGHGNRDTVPAMLTPREVVLTEKQQAQLGSSMGVGAKGIQRFAKGGVVPVPGRSPTGALLRDQGTWKLGAGIGARVPLRRDIGGFLSQYLGRGLSRAKLNDAQDFWQKWGPTVITNSKAGGYHAPGGKASKGGGLLGGILGVAKRGYKEFQSTSSLIDRGIGMGVLGTRPSTFAYAATDMLGLTDVMPKGEPHRPYGKLKSGKWGFKEAQPHFQERWEKWWRGLSADKQSRYWERENAGVLLSTLGAGAMAGAAAVRGAAGLSVRQAFVKRFGAKASLAGGKDAASARLMRLMVEEKALVRMGRLPSAPPGSLGAADAMTRANGGGTFIPGTLESVAGTDPAHFLSGIGAYSKMVPAAKYAKQGKRAIASYRLAHAKLFAAHPNFRLGTWVDPDTGNLHLDIVKAFTKAEKAVSYAKKQGQIAAFDLSTFNDLPTGLSESRALSIQKQLAKGARTKKASPLANLVYGHRGTIQFSVYNPGTGKKTPLAQLPDSYLKGYSPPDPRASLTSVSMKGFGPKVAAAAKRLKTEQRGSFAPFVPKAYRGQHTAPQRQYGDAPLNNLADPETGVFPADVYKPGAGRLYGHRGSPEQNAMDEQTAKIIRRYKGTPNDLVPIYRAVPRDVKGADINPGDWVTVNRAYAEMHGRQLGVPWKIAERRVRAREVFSDGNSIHEFGYDPGTTSKIRAAASRLKDETGTFAPFAGREGPKLSKSAVARAAKVTKGIWKDSAGVEHLPLGKEPGAVSIPKDHVRLYHYTGSIGDIVSIAKTGIRNDRAKGESYMEPSQIWASARKPDEHLKDFAEFSVRADDPRLDIGRFDYPYTNPKTGNPHTAATWAAMKNASGQDSTLPFGDIRPGEIVNYSEPWMSHVRYLMNEIKTRSQLHEPQFGPGTHTWAENLRELGPEYRTALDWMSENLPMGRSAAAKVLGQKGASRTLPVLMDMADRAAALKKLPPEAWRAGEHEPLGGIRDALSAGPGSTVAAMIGSDGSVVAAGSWTQRQGYGELESLGAVLGGGRALVRLASVQTKGELRTTSVPSAAKFYEAIGFKKTGADEMTGYPTYALQKGGFKVHREDVTSRDILAMTKGITAPKGMASSVQGVLAKSGMKIPPALEGRAGIATLDRVWRLAMRGAEYRHWYDDAGEVLAAVGREEPGLSLDKLSGMVGLWSQRRDPTANLKLAVSKMKGYSASRPVEGGLPGQAFKSNEILGGRGWGGRKTNAFAMNILEEADPKLFKKVGKGNEVTLDYIMAQMFLGKDTPDPYYDAIELAVQEMAKRAGWKPKEFQAAAWVPYKAAFARKKVLGGGHKPKGPWESYLPAPGDRAYGKAFEAIYGYSPFKADGGVMTGGRPGRDSIPALLTPGEVVLNASHIARLTGNLGIPNSGPALFKQATKMATGGVVPPRPYVTTMVGAGVGAATPPSSGDGIYIEHMEITVPPQFNDTEWAIQQGLKKAKFRLLNGV